MSRNLGVEGDYPIVGGSLFARVKISTMRLNMLANVAAQAWTGLIGFAIVPIYIHYLGIEAYGVIGLFATLQTVFVLLDLGLTPTLMREMAGFTSGKQSVDEIRDLLRSVEVICCFIATAVAFSIALGSGWLSHHWFKTEKIQPELLQRSLAIMGFVCALRFLEGLYRGSLLGLQRQVLFNAISVSMATTRALGAVAVLTVFHKSLDAFFVWQGIISLSTVILLRLATSRALPPPTRAIRLSRQAIQDIRGFASGVLAITLLSIALAELDKLLLSRLLPLRVYGYYTLAFVGASSLIILTSPLLQAIVPRFSQLQAQGDEEAFTRLYHQAAQLVSVVAGTGAIVIVLHGQMLLTLWTHDTTVASNAAPIVRLLAVGNLLNLLMWAPYNAQLAHRWTRLTVRVNTVAVMLVVPLLLVFVPRYGAIAAGWVWIGLNAGYFITIAHFMHKRILVREKWRWYCNDVFAPLLSGCAAAVLLSSALSLKASPLIWSLVGLALLGGGTFLAATLGSSELRPVLLGLAKLRPRSQDL